MPSCHLLFLLTLALSLCPSLSVPAPPSCPHVQPHPPRGSWGSQLWDLGPLQMAWNWREVYFGSWWIPWAFPNCLGGWEVFEASWVGLGGWGCRTKRGDTAVTSWCPRWGHRPSLSLRTPGRTWPNLCQLPEPRYTAYVLGMENGGVLRGSALACPSRGSVPSPSESSVTPSC
jgi:hypothetical protein